MSKEKRISGKFRKWCHILHRDLSFFFAGVILIYAFSGIMLNHKRDFNSDYSITQKEYRIAGNFPKAKADFSKAYVLDLLDDLGERNNYTTRTGTGRSSRTFLPCRSSSSPSRGLSCLKGVKASGDGAV